MSMFKLLLRELQKTAKKVNMAMPTLNKAITITQDVPKRANDAMTLSSICDFDGNVHKLGALILQVSHDGCASGCGAQLCSVQKLFIDQC